MYLTGYVIVPNAVFNNTNKGNGTYGQCDRILSTEECLSAGQQLTSLDRRRGDQFLLNPFQAEPQSASIFFDTVNEGALPSGCLLYQQDVLLYNYHTTSDDYEYSPDYQPICYENPAQPNYHGKVIFQSRMAM